MHTKLSFKTFLLSAFFGLGVAGSAQAAYQDLDDSDYEEYFLHLTENVVDPGAAGIGDITLGSANGAVLQAPNGACGFYMEDVEGTLWTSPEYSAGPDPYHITFKLPLPGCSTNQIIIDTDEGQIVPIFPGEEFVVQSWIAYWVDNDGEKISGFCATCPGSAVNDYLDSMNSASRLLEVRLDLISAALAGNDNVEAFAWLADVVNLQSNNVSQLNRAIARRQRHHLGDVELSVAALENASASRANAALQGLQTCQAHLAAGDINAAKRACDASIVHFKQSNAAIREAGRLTP